MGWLLLLLGFALWFATHLFKPAAPARHARAVERLGDGPVKGIVSLLSIVAISLIVIGYRDASFVNVWFPPAWTTHLNNLLNLAALGMFFAGNIPGHVRSWVRHPQLTGVKIWSVSHLLVNGHLAAIVLFGGFLTWAVVALVAINKRDGKPPKPEPTGGLKADAAHLGIALVAYAVVSAFHWYVGGVWPFGGAPPA